MKIKEKDIFADYWSDGEEPDNNDFTLEEDSVLKDLAYNFTNSMVSCKEEGQVEIDDLMGSLARMINVNPRWAVKVSDDELTITDEQVSPDPPIAVPYLNLQKTLSVSEVLASYPNDADLQLAKEKEFATIITTNLSNVAHYYEPLFFNRILTGDKLKIKFSDFSLEALSAVLPFKDDYLALPDVKDFHKVLLSLCSQHDIHPLLILIPIGAESRYNPFSINKASGNLGLLQFGSEALEGFKKTSTEMLALSATKQLPYVFEFLKTPLNKKGSLALFDLHIYAWLPIIFNGHMAGKQMIAAVKGSTRYNNHVSFDLQNKGFITNLDQIAFQLKTQASLMNIVVDDGLLLNPAEAYEKIMKRKDLLDLSKTKEIQAKAAAKEDVIVTDGKKLFHNPYKGKGTIEWNYLDLSDIILNRATVLLKNKTVHEAALELNPKLKLFMKKKDWTDFKESDMLVILDYVTSPKAKATQLARVKTANPQYIVPLCLTLAYIAKCNPELAFVLGNTDRTIEQQMKNYPSVSKTLFSYHLMQLAADVMHRDTGLKAPNSQLVDLSLLLTVFGFHAMGFDVDAWDWAHNNFKVSPYATGPFEKRKLFELFGFTLNADGPVSRNEDFTLLEPFSFLTPPLWWDKSHKYPDLNTFIKK